jgi:hypothetical protein
VDITPIEKAIGARLAADTGSGGLRNGDSPLVTGIYNTAAVSTQQLPAIVYTVTSVDFDDSFGDARREVFFDVHIMVPLVSDTIADTMKRGGDILQRVEGDWFEQSDRTPTYGLERHKLSLGVGTSWVAEMIEAQDLSAQHEDNVLHWVVTYRVGANRAGA